MVPCQALHAPLFTVFGMMVSFTVFVTSVVEHLLKWALAVPAYPKPELVRVIVNGAAAKSGALTPALVVSLKLVAAQFAVKCHESVHCSPSYKLAPPPGVLVVLTVTET